MIEVRFNRGLYLPEADLWLDPWDAKPRAFVSHAHADHFARHESSLCSETTAVLLRRRYGVQEGRLEPLPFHVPLVREGFRFRLLPAGHIAGSAMLHVTRTRDNATLLYTGDFKTRRGRTAEPVCFQNADTLIIETTFGLPQFSFPPALEIESAILRFVHDAFTDGETPVLFGYSLGKAQEALALLHEHEIPVLLHPTVAEMTVACREAGVDLPEPILFEGFAEPGHVIIAPPNAIRSRALRGLKSKRTAMLTGWALQPGAKYRYRVDEVFPLSDHADHPGLLECVQRVRPRRILTVHGYAHEFAAELRGKRFDAWCAMGGDQLELAMGGVPQRPAATIQARHNRPICALADFSDACRLVGETSSRIAKIEFLANYLKGLESDHDLRLAAGWLTGEALPKAGGRRTLQTGSAALRRALIALPGAREERYNEISLTQNDTARTARLFLQELSLKPEPLDLAGLEGFFRELSAACGSIARIELLSPRLRTLHPAEGETLVKLLTGDLRIGLKEGLVEDAIASAFAADPADVRHAHMLTGDLGETAILARYQRLEEAVLRPFVPVKSMLASPTADAVEIWDWHSADNNGPLWVEPKYDGIRLQLHKVGNRVSLFSRDLQPLDDAFPDIITAAAKLPCDCVLDGELVAFAEGRRLGFNDLQQRLGRQVDQNELFLTEDAPDMRVPLRFIIFDILWHAGESLLDQSLLERRMRLDSFEIQEPFRRIAVAQIDSPELLDAAFKESLGAGHEGLIAKDQRSLYQPGRRSHSWLKLKGMMPTLDCVVVAAEQGHGKRSDVLSDYTFAVRDIDTGALKTIGKAYSGLTDDEIEDLTEHFQRHTLTKERRKHLVEPNVVLEIAFDSIRASDRHDSGLALRFPRIKTIRKDKTPEEIDTLQYARSLVKS
ncbi:ATP-dependent DNA ligase [Luteolibacter ambystomatis]|uniref:DNA ligase (ATP) n=1 Tax=Luteolibacter ambystomatis TaxID=2824561 RepID=A0A975J2Q4_9BACT|nr:ATP-dependent DNA ligase [Luteolibacter ambystomatis]QUE52923.1 ATP-dependent DNA ligase [Luteolibacter ambystomatis]